MGVWIVNRSDHCSANCGKKIDYALGWILCQIFRWSLSMSECQEWGYMTTFNQRFEIDIFAIL